MLLAGIHFIIFNLISKILIHYSGLCDLPQPFLSPFAMRIVLCLRQLPNFNSLRSPARTTSKHWAVIARHSQVLNYRKRTRAIYRFKNKTSKIPQFQTLHLTRRHFVSIYVHGKSHVTKPKSKQKHWSLILADFLNQSPSTNYELINSYLLITSCITLFELRKEKRDVDKLAWAEKVNGFRMLVIINSNTIMHIKKSKQIVLIGSECWQDMLCMN